MYYIDKTISKEQRLQSEILNEKKQVDELNFLTNEAKKINAMTSKHEIGILAGKVQTHRENFLKHQTYVDIASSLMFYLSRCLSDDDAWIDLREFLDNLS